jgi:single-strand DNA-binding protein
VANDINTVTLTGRLGTDPELRTTPSGLSVTELRIAVGGSKKTGSGVYEDTVGWYTVTVFGGQAEATARYMHKGSQVAISGRLDYQEWTTDEGQKRSAVKVVANSVLFLGSKGDSERGYPDEEPASDVTPRESHNDSSQGGTRKTSYDDVPF